MKWTAFKLSWCVSLIIHGVIIVTAAVVHYRHAAISVGESGDAGIEIIIGLPEAAEISVTSRVVADVQAAKSESATESFTVSEEIAPFPESVSSQPVTELLSDPLTRPSASLSPSDGERGGVRGAARQNITATDESNQSSALVSNEGLHKAEYAKHAAIHAAEIITQSWVTHLDNPNVVYPKEARRRKQQGSVLLSVSVSVVGLPEDVQVKQSSGFVLLDNAALEAARKWRFVPARIGDVNMASAVELPIQFKLTDKK